MQTLVEALANSRPALLKQAQRMLRGSGGVEDATQDALLSALAHLPYFRGDAQLGTWLYRVGANAVLMNLRKERRASERTRRAMQALPRESSWLHGCGSGDAPHRLLEAAQQADALRSAIAALPEHYRQVVAACDLDERPVDEVAKDLGMTVGGVRTRRLRAHRLLKHALRARAELVQ